MLTLRSSPSLQHNKEREELHRLQAKHGAAFAAKLARRGRDGCERAAGSARQSLALRFVRRSRNSPRPGRDEDEDEDEDDEESSSEEEQVDLEVRRRSTLHCVVSFR